MENLPYVAPLDLCIKECLKKELHEWIDEILPKNLVHTAREKLCNAQFSAQNTQWVDGEAVLDCQGKGKGMEYSSFSHEILPSSQVKPRLPKAITLIAGRTFGPIGEHYYYSDAISVPEAPEIPSRMHYVVPAPFRISPLRLTANSTFVEN